VRRTYLAALICALACVIGAVCLAAVPYHETRGADPPLVTVVADGKVYQLQSTSATVREVLVELEIALGPLDRTAPSPDTLLADRMVVQVTRVARWQEVEEVSVPSRLVVLADPQRPAGLTEIVSEGRGGRLRRLVTIWEKDGQETARSVSQEQVLTKAEDTVVLRGSEGLPSRGGNWRIALRMTATAYDPGPRSCGRYADGTTATGAKAEKGVVATDPRVIPMGTRLYIPGYGFAVAADRGSAIKGMRIDLCYNTYREAVQFGRRKVDVYVLD